MKESQGAFHSLLFQITLSVPGAVDRVAPAPGSDILVKLRDAHLLQEIVARGRGMVRLTAHVKVNEAQLVLPRYLGW